MDQKKYKVVVVSDSHGVPGILEMIVQANPDADLFIHCGDLEDNPLDYPEWVFVRGNNDFFPTPTMPMERIVRVGEHRIYVTHSHRISYSGREKQLVRIAREHNCDIVCFGHTHCSLIERDHEVLLVNPGSVWSSRDSRLPSYAILYLQGFQVEAELVFEDAW